MLSHPGLCTHGVVNSTPQIITYFGIGSRASIEMCLYTNLLYAFFPVFPKMVKRRGVSCISSQVGLVVGELGRRIVKKGKEPAMQRPGIEPGISKDFLLSATFGDPVHHS